MGPNRSRGQRFIGKKKNLNLETDGIETIVASDRLNLYSKSAYGEKPIYLDLESFGKTNEAEPSEEESEDDAGLVNPWDLATRYHELKRKKGFRKKGRELRRGAALAILDRAQGVIGPISRPARILLAAVDEISSEADRIEFDEEESVEASVLLDEILYRHELRKKFPVVIAVDTSLSMTGEKMALTAVALAVLMFQFSEDPISIVAFENEATVIQSPFRPLGVLGVIERFLDVPARGYTDLERGLKKALSESADIKSRLRGRPVSTLLLTDGKYTAGRNPVYMADRFSHLMVLKTGDEASSLPLCEELAHHGNGQVLVVPELEDLPKAMVRIVKGLLRGYRV